MIRTDSSAGKSLKELRRQEQQQRDQELTALCAAKVAEKYPDVDFAQLSNKHKGLFFLPLMDEDDKEIEKIAVLKPIDRHILSYASTKIEDEGLYTFLGAVLESCWLMGDDEIKNDDEFFIPACGKINKIIEGKKAHLLKR